MTDDHRLAPDGREYALSVRNLPVYSWGRPPIPASCADELARVLAIEQVSNVLVLGSCCPSVLTALAFGDPDRLVNVIDQGGRWGEGVHAYMDDTPDHNLPPVNTGLSPTNHRFLYEWSWRTLRCDALFVDLSFRHRLVAAEVAIIQQLSPQLVFLGFLEGHDGPQDALDWLERRHWSITRLTSTITNNETRAELRYELIIARQNLWTAPRPAAAAQHDE